MTAARRALCGLALAVAAAQGALVPGPGRPARVAARAPLQAAPPGRVDPVFLPALGPPRAGEPGGCGARIAIQNAGAVPTRALLIGWGAPATCVPADCRAAAAVHCTGLLAPGGAWLVDAAAFGAPLTSAVVLGVAGAACDALAALPALRGCQGYAGLRAAWDAGEPFHGIDLGAAYGAPLAVEVTRECTDPADKSRRLASAYAGVSGSRFGGYDRVFAVSTHVAVVVRAEADGTASALHVQNGGARCASVEVWFQSRGACRIERLCAVTSQLPPGGTLVQPMGGCAPEGTAGTAWVVSSEPPVVVVDLVGGHALASYTAIPADLRRAFEGPPAYTAGSDVLVAPLAWADDATGSTLHVQNLSAVEPALVQATALGGGRVLARATLCPRGAATLLLAPMRPRAARDGAPPSPPGLRVESLAGRDPDGARIAPPNIAAVLELRAPGDAAAAIELWPVSRAAGEDGSPGGTSRAAQALALPAVARAADDTLGTSTRLAVAPLAREAVGGRYLLGLFDANGLVDVACRPIVPGGDALDLAAYGPVGADFRGSALVSAVHWTRAGEGPPYRPGLAAAALHRPHARGVHAGPRHPGDAWRVVEGVALPRGWTHALSGTAAGLDCAAAARSDARPEPTGPGAAWLPVGWVGR